MIDNKIQQELRAMDAENLNTGYPVMKAVSVGLSVVF